MGRHLETYEAIHAACGVEHRTQNIARAADVGGRQRLVHLRRAQALARETLDVVVVGGASLKRLIEDARIGRDATKPLVVHAASELAVVQHVARKIIQPIALAVVGQLEERIHGCLSIASGGGTDRVWPTVSAMRYRGERVARNRRRPTADAQ